MKYLIIIVLVLFMILNKRKEHFKKNKVGPGRLTDGYKILEKLKNEIKKNKILKNEEGVFNIKGDYIIFEGEHLLDLIFKNIHDINKIDINTLTNLYHHGNTIETVNNTVTAGIKGLHIYLTTNNNLIGIVNRI